MFAYLIARLDMTDAERAKDAYPRYVAEAGPAYASHQARFLVRGGTPHHIEGRGRARNVVIGFPTLPAARACYMSDTYQHARRHRLPVAEGEIVLVEGLTAELPAETPSAGEPGAAKKGYWISRYDVRDMEQYRLYAEAAAPAFAEAGALFLARSGTAEAMEGEARGRNVLIEFPSVEAALGCWHSPGYQQARAHRLPVSDADITIVEGL